MPIRDVTPELYGTGLAVAVVRSTFNSELTRQLLDGALGALAEAQVLDVTVIDVSGALELPVVTRHLAENHDAVVALGVVIEGETDHYEHVASQAMAGLMQVSIMTGVPVGNGLLTVRAAQHAIDRSELGEHNKGHEAAQAAVAAALAIRAL
jgi:6,7-dimethyl-8-ribityllumazine synthase